VVFQVYFMLSNNWIQMIDSSQRQRKEPGTIRNVVRYFDANPSLAMIPMIWLADAIIKQFTSSDI
jgi:hypothetical protein